MKNGSEIVVTSTPSLTLGATGVSPTAVALREIGIEASATEFLQLFFQHGAAPRYALTTPTAITDQAKADAIREKWAQTYGGVGNWTQVALLHARMSGMVRDFGFCVAASLIGIVVAFSWFHVNLLGIGLHAYGFSSATKVALFRYYAIQGGLTAVGAAGTLLQMARKPAAAGLGAPAVR